MFVIRYASFCEKGYVKVFGMKSSNTNTRALKIQIVNITPAGYNISPVLNVDSLELGA